MCCNSVATKHIEITSVQKNLWSSDLVLAFVSVDVWCSFMNCQIIDVKRSEQVLRELFVWRKTFILELTNTVFFVLHDRFYFKLMI
jgi:hypothetical protein